MNRTRNSVRQAFTLIELLVVIAIIAILAAILFPVFAQAKLAAKHAVSESNIKQLLLATIMYQNDYDDVYPLLRQGHAKWECNYGPGSVYINCNQADTAAASVNPYIKTQQIWTSPNDSIARNDCPTYPTVYSGNNTGAPVSYSYNYYGLQTVGGYSNSPYAQGLVGWEDNYSSGTIASWSTYSLASTQVDNPADTVLMYPYYASFSYYLGQQAYSIDGRRTIYSDPSIYGITLWPNVITGYFWCSPADAIAIGAYGNQTDYGWADGHVKSKERSSIMSYQYVTNGPAAIAANAHNELSYQGQFH